VRPTLRSDTEVVSTAPGDQVVFDPGASGFGSNSSAAPAADCRIVGRNVTTGAATTCAERLDEVPHEFSDQAAFR
jgi:hypothetical protein